MTGATKDAAEALKAELVALGAEVELKGQKPTVQEGPSGNGNRTKTKVDIFLKSPGAQKLAVIKKIKESLTIGLKDAKDRVDQAPSIIMEGVAREVAEKLKTELVALGAEVELR
jgi:large subunit ribosomal protein L7/L12